MNPAQPDYAFIVTVGLACAVALSIAVVVLIQIRPRLSLHNLRIAFSATCVVACVLLIALWVRSYWYGDQVYCQYSRYELTIFSLRGGAEIRLRRQDYDSKFFQTWHDRLPDGVAMLDEHGDRVSNWWLYVFDYGHAYVPYWIIALPIAALAAAPRLRWSRRFSLRTLLIAMTLVAAVLGLAVYTVRK